MNQMNQKGSFHLLVVLGIVILAGVGFAGYKVITSSTKDKSATTSTAETVPDTIQSKQDLQQASSALDADGVDSELDPAQLDADLNGLL